MRISDWSSDVCSSDLRSPGVAGGAVADTRTGAGNYGPAVRGARRHVAYGGNRTDESGRTVVGHGGHGRRPVPPHPGAALLGRRRRHATFGGGVLPGWACRSVGCGRGAYGHRTRYVLVAN